MPVYSTRSQPISAFLCLPQSFGDGYNAETGLNYEQQQYHYVCMCVGMYVRSDLPQETLIIPQIGKPHPPSPTSWAQNKDETNTMGTWGA